MVNLGKNLKELFKKSKKPEEVEAATVVHLESAEEPEREMKIEESKDLTKNGEKVKAERKKDGEKRESVDEKRVEEDSVAADVRKLKLFIAKAKKKIEELIGPGVTSGLKKAGESLSSAGTIIKPGLLKKILQVVLVVGLLGVIAYFGIKGFNFVRKDSQKEELRVPSPTPASYQPYKPSVYAEDSEVLAIEEVINVLKREVSLTNIRETTLNPPSLDFDVDF